MKKMQFLFFMKNMLVKILEFGHMQQKIYIFYFEIFLFFWNISEKIGYFNTGFVFYSVHIQPDIMQNW